MILYYCLKSPLPEISQNISESKFYNIEMHKNQQDFKKIMNLWTLNIQNLDFYQINFRSTLHPVYSELGYSEYPLMVNGSLHIDR